MKTEIIDKNKNVNQDPELREFYSLLYTNTLTQSYQEFLEIKNTMKIELINSTDLVPIIFLVLKLNLFF